MSIISSLFRGLSSKKVNGQDEKDRADKLMEHIRYKDELATRVQGSVLVNKIIDEIIAFAQSAAGEACIQHDGGITIIIDETSYSYHECNYCSSDGPSYCHGRNYADIGYKEINDIAFLDEFANYTYQRINGAINSTYIVSTPTCTRSPRYGKGFTRDKYGVNKRDIVGEWHRYYITIKQQKNKKQELKDW